MELQRVGEVVEANTTDFIAQCYEVYCLPPLGSLVKTGDGGNELYAVVCNASTTGIEPGRHPVARGKDAVTEADIYQSNPQLMKLLKSEFSAMVVGHRLDGKLYQYLPPQPARIHGFVYSCPTEEIKEFSKSLAFLNILLNSRQPVQLEELVAACLRQMCHVHEDRSAFLITAGKELALLLSGQFSRLNTILQRIKE